MPLPTDDRSRRRLLLWSVALCGLGADYCLQSGFGQGAKAESRPNVLMAGTNGSVEEKSGGGKFTRYRNARFGYELSHPETFVAEEPPQNGAGQSWISADGTFELNSFASFNSDGATPERLKQDLVRNNPRYRKADVATVAGDVVWVFSDEGPRAYGYAAIFSCRNQIVNVVEMSFPSKGPNRQRHNDLITSTVTGFTPDRSPECATGGSGASSAPGAAQSDDIFSDPSLKRLALYGWSTGGLQDGLWTAAVHGERATSNRQMLARLR